jgi:acyl-coenzyme A thioesterase PaaI-like protein
MIPDQVIAIINEKLGDKVEDYLIPPPVFTSMQGEFVELALDEGILVNRFPVLKEYLNPYGAVQGGIVAASVDNTLGPLSMLVAPPNVTRTLEMKYSRPVTPDLEYITVKAKFMSQEGQFLHFRAEVRDMAGNLLARAKATHWVLDEDNS